MSRIEAQFIDKQTDREIDFETILKQAIDLIQRLSGHIWTDYNLHDPGITILEQLCFALTDLHYKMQLDTEDLLTDKNGEINRLEHAFFEKEYILTCNPVTPNDFRKVLLDQIEELDNVMLIPVLSTHSNDYIKGLYKIIVRINKTTARAYIKDKEIKDRIKEKITRLYLSKRNICEDIMGEVVILEPQKIVISTNINVKYTSAPEELLLEIYNKIEALLNPKIPVYSELELVDKAYSMDQIYDGPLLENGIILERELRPIPTEIDPTDLTDAITSIGGVNYIQNLDIKNASVQLGINESIPRDNKPFKVDENYFAYLDMDDFVAHVNLYADDYRLSINRDLLLEIYEYNEPMKRRNRKVYMNKTRDRTIKSGVYKNLDSYYSIQNYFPNNYGIGIRGLPNSEGKERKALALQLKAYLAFFEQIMANFGAQLKNLNLFYSTDISIENQISYYTQGVYSIPGIQDVLKAFKKDNKHNNPGIDELNWKNFQNDAQNDYITALKQTIETPEIYCERKNAIFDHLLGRFNRKISIYPILQYFNTYISGNKAESDLFILRWKAHLLNNLIAIDQSKIKGFDYSSEVDEISGFEYKISMYLGISQTEFPDFNQFIPKATSIKRRKLSSVFNNRKNYLIKDSLEEIKEDKLVKLEGVTVMESSIENIRAMKAVGVFRSIDLQNSSVFSKQRISLLEFGLLRENYKIVRDQQKYFILYASPIKEIRMADKVWQAIGSYPTKEAAIVALNQVISYFKQLSINSEGFHLIEHVLMRPRIEQPLFGFQYLENENTVLFKNDKWLTFDEREQLLARIKDDIKNERQIKTDDALNFQVLNRETRVFGTVEETDLPSGSKGFYDYFEKLVTELNKTEEDKTLKYPRLVLTVKLSDHTIVEEAFYSLKATIVLPSWPARFQDNEFKAFVEDTIRSLAPSYLILKFRWLGISRMQQFEDLYFNWLEGIRGKATPETRLDACVALTQWLRKQDVKPIKRQ